MTRARGTLRFIYHGLALLALVACWHQNYAFKVAGGHDFAGVFVAFWPALLANHATTSITIDILLFALAASIWMVIEARRLRIRLVWVYIVLASLIAISVLYPLFLSVRERHLEADGAPPPGMTAFDVAGLVLLSLPAVALSIWSLGVF